MGKLAVFMALRKELTFEYERELRAVRNLIMGASRISGSDYTIDLANSDGFIAGSRARAAFAEAFNAAIHEALLKYAHDLAHESLEYGIDQTVINGALAGTIQMQPRIVRDQQPAPGMAPPTPDGNMVRLVS
jgi:hypothetical protein